jgi:hypothetical protein
MIEGGGGWRWRLLAAVCFSPPDGGESVGIERRAHRALRKSKLTQVDADGTIVKFFRHVFGVCVNCPTVCVLEGEGG